MGISVHNMRTIPGDASIVAAFYLTFRLRRLSCTPEQYLYQPPTATRARFSQLTLLPCPWDLFDLFIVSLPHLLDWGPTAAQSV